MVKLDTLTVRIRDVLRGGGYGGLAPPGYVKSMASGRFSDSNKQFKPPLDKHLNILQLI